MGLVVSVYKNIKRTKKKDVDDVDFFAHVIDDSWKHKVKNLEYGKAYTGDLALKAISYSCTTHNRFREKLLRLVGREDLLGPDGKILWDNLTPDVPFYDLIDFADNEGCLDWEISEKIYSDFKKWEGIARTSPNILDFIDVDYYMNWLETFGVARDNGVVVFR